jgi:hypothetical protein
MFRMTCAIGGVVLAGTLAGGGCEAREMSVARLTPLFGPVVGSEMISGHVVDAAGRVVLLAGGSTMVTIDLQERTHRTGRLRLPPQEDCWGLARLADDSLWTLIGWNTVAQVSAAGTIERTIDLAVAHLGLFGVGERLVLQQASLPAGTAALFAGRPGDPARTPWSDMTTRAFDQLATGAAAALNLVACGSSASREVPCWFPDEPVVSLIAADGATRRIELAGLARVAPEALINAKFPPRPIRDVYVERGGSMWVISSGEAPTGKKSARGGWILARYGPRGEPIDRRLLPEPARLILRAGHGRALVLTSAGMVAEVQP